MPTPDASFTINFSADQLVKLAHAYNEYYSSDTSVKQLDPNELSNEDIALLLDLYTDWIGSDFNDTLADMKELDGFKKNNPEELKLDEA